MSVKKVKVTRTIKGLCAVLRQQDKQHQNINGKEKPTTSANGDTDSLKKWERFEERVKSIYNTLLNLKGEKVAVSRDVILVGRTGVKHQFDVYYEFSRADIVHRVAIECRDKSRALNKDAVIAFCHKVSDVPGIRGIMVSAKGYQSGAKKIAEDNGIIAITMNDLPRIGSLIAETIEDIALPSKDTVGEPFWSLYELEDGKTNGNLFSKLINGWYAALLFVSKRQCEDFLALQEPDVRDRYAVRGIAQRHLLGFIMIADTHAANYFIVLDRNPQYSGLIAPISREQLIKDFVTIEHRLPANPMIFPEYEKEIRQP